MGTMMDYIKEYGGYTFMEKPIGEVDSLIFAQLSYLKFDGLVPEAGTGGSMVTLETLREREDYDNLYADERYREQNTALYLAMADSRRFKTLKLGSYVNKIELDKETQFSAVTLQMEDGAFYIAYRGTDETIVGWKEDLNLAFSEPVPGQVMSVEYLNQVAQDITTPFYMGGHSKGGNLAIYAAMNCKKEIQDKIKIIFNHDGPGFRPEVKEKCGYCAIEDRVYRTVPHSSLVGMILYAEGSYRVVESKNIGLTQHDPYSWLVEKDAFRVVKRVYSHNLLMDTALNDWILSLSQEQMHIFVDTLYEVVLASESDNLIDFTANWKKSIQGILEAVKNVDAENLQIMGDMLKKLFEMLSQHIKEDRQNKRDIQKGKLEEGIGHLEQLFKK
ncbi:MAG: DUF2974 domain-containing protein [Blautia sp.]|nr:DUF2974 domain-containing protein [Lachnoclostridium sp.]MCM1212314.1 DUF2974 domain-containing protein [Blautia sp.]